MPDAVQVDLVADNVVTDPVRPHLQAPLADPLAFELLDLGVRPLGCGPQVLEGVEPRAYLRGFLAGRLRRENGEWIAPFRKRAVVIHWAVK